MRYLALVLAVAVASSVGAQPSWERVADHGDLRTLLVLPDGAVLAGTETDGLRSADGVVSFDTLRFEVDNSRAYNSNFDLPEGRIRDRVYQFGLHPSGIVIAATETGGFRSADAGQTWVEVAPRPLQGECYQDYSAYTAVAVAPDGTLVLFGVTESPSPSCKIETFAVRSSDGGTWRGTTRFVGGASSGAALAMEGGSVTINGGSWIVRLGPEETSQTNVEPSSLSALVAVGDALYAALVPGRKGGAGGVLRSDDGGRTWARADDGLYDRPVTALAVTADGTVLAGTADGGVFALSPAAQGQWKPVSLGLDATTDADGDGTPDALAVLSLAVGPDGRAWVATRGGLYRTAAQVVAGEDAPDAAPVSVSVWPNPASSSVTVALAGRAGEGTVRVEAFDGLGRRVAVVHDGPLSARLSVDVSGWPAGVYIVRAVSAGGAASARLVVGR